MSVANEPVGKAEVRAAVPSNFYRDGRFTWHQRRRHALVRRLMKGLEGKRVLDYGCGYGDLSYAISKTNPVVGIDVDSERVAFAQSQYPELEFHQFDGEAAPFADGSFDVVLSCVVLPFVPDHETTLRDVRRVMSDNGALLLVSKNVSVLADAFRRLIGKQPTIPRLNIVPKSKTGEMLTRLGFRIKQEDYFFDPPFADVRSTKAIVAGAAEQLLSLAGIANAAGYIAWRADLSQKEFSNAES